MINLFPDQEETIARLRQSLGRNRKVLLQAATGWGKSIGASYMIAGTQRKNKTSIFTVPRRQLIDQMSENFNKFGIEHGFIASGYPDTEHPTRIASLDTILNRDFKSPDIAFIDETHYGGEKLDELIARLQGYLVGLSATPWLFSGKGLGKYYDDMVEGPSIAELIRLKRLSEFRYFSPSAPDFSSLKTIDGDYKKKDIETFMEGKPTLIGDAITHYQRHAAGLLNIAFCTGVKHSQMTAEAFRNAGIAAQHVDANTKDDDRFEIFRAYARREIKVLTCAELLIFGFDLEAASGGMKVTVEAMSDLAPTKSLAKQMQKWGRVLRAKPTPAIIFDHSSNWKNNGWPDTPREWSLKDRVKKPTSSGGIIAMTQCPLCYHMFRPAPTCPHCGDTRDVKERPLLYRDGDLQEIDRQRAAELQQEEERKKIAIRIKVGKAKSFAELRQIGEELGYEKGWAFHKAKARGWV